VLSMAFGSEHEGEILRSKRTVLTRDPAEITNQCNTNHVPFVERDIFRL
jgi:hypothetical protein